MQTDMIQILDKLPKETAALIKKCANSTDVEKTLTNFGITLSTEEINKLKETFSQNEISLSDTDLEQVAGGTRR